MPFHMAGQCLDFTNSKISDQLGGISHVQTGILAVFATEIVQYSVLDTYTKPILEARRPLPTQPTEIRFKTDLEHRLNQQRISVEKATLHSVGKYMETRFG